MATHIPTLEVNHIQVILPSLVVHPLEAHPFNRHFNYSIQAHQHLQESFLMSLLLQVKLTIMLHELPSITFIFGILLPSVYTIQVRLLAFELDVENWLRTLPFFIFQLASGVAIAKSWRLVLTVRLGH